MARLTGNVIERLSVPSDDVFAILTDAHRLPDWNEKIHHVVDAPTRAPRRGDEWLVEVRAMGSRWNSRSRIEEVDPLAKRFSLRSQTDDGNPSFARWTWQITPTEGGSEVTVSWEVNPKTFWRTILLSRIRHRQLKQEVRESLRAAERVLRSREGDVGSSDRASGT